MLFFTIKIDEALDVGSLCTGSRCINDVLEDVGITQEFSVFDIVVLVAINKGDSVGLGLINLKAKSIEYLTEELWRYPEGAQGVSVLEEALRVESISPHNFAECFHHLAYHLALSLIRLTPAIDSCGAHITNGVINCLLKVFRRENFVNLVRELPPADMSSFLWRFIRLSQLFELSLRDGAFRHSEADTELSCSDIPRSKSIEVAEEFGDADSLLLAPRANAGNNIIDIVRSVTNNFCLAGAGLGLRVVVGAVIEALTDTKELITSINVFTEINIIALVDISLVHVTFEEGLENLLRGIDSEQVEHAEELLLGNVAIASDIVVLEHWF